MLGKQAKILNDTQIRAVLAALATHRYPSRDRVMFLLSVKAGFRAIEISAVTWGMVLDCEGNIADALALENRASKGRRGGRLIPLHPELKAALIAFYCERGDKARPELPIIFSERDRGLSPNAVAVWFHKLYRTLGMIGCSSHSGRRTFITRGARKVSELGGSLRDIQELVGHRSLSTTMRYIAGDRDVQRKLVRLI